MGLDGVALAFAVGYGVFMGSYPVPIKTPSVLAADVHPLIFQSFKSAWVLLTSLLVLIPIAAEEHTVQLTWWGVASAAGWVPSGLCTIFAVSTIGLSMAIVVSCASAAVLSFLVFWLVFQEKIKEHTIDGHTVYLAPAYLAAIVVGMAGLVFAPRLAGGRSAKKANGDSPPSPSAEQLMPVAADVEGGSSDGDGGKHVQGGTLARRVLAKGAGLAAAFGSGFFSAVQYGVITAGKAYEKRRAGCYGDGVPPCPPALVEQFNNFGSWMLSFGLGAALVTTAFLALLACARRLGGRAPPRVHWRTMRVPGSVAGICWSIANFFGTAAAARGGNAIVMAQMQVIQLVTSGLWGLFYYGELRGRAAWVWGAFAVWTIGAMVLLGMEKGS